MTLDSQLHKLIVQNDIEELLARFDDAVIRYDRESFRSLWTEKGVWEISDPVPMRAVGIEAIEDALAKFHNSNQFFFRSTSRPVIHVDGDRATFRSPTVELARREGNLGYSNVAVYYDLARFDGGRWQFEHRYYQYLWVDLSTPLNGDVVSLALRERGGSQP